MGQWVNSSGGGRGVEARCVSKGAAGAVPKAASGGFGGVSVTNLVQGVYSLWMECRCSVPSHPQPAIVFACPVIRPSSAGTEAALSPHPARSRQA